MNFLFFFLANLLSDYSVWRVYVWKSVTGIFPYFIAHHANLGFGKKLDRIRIHCTSIVFCFPSHSLPSEVKDKKVKNQHGNQSIYVFVLLLASTRIENFIVNCRCYIYLLSLFHWNVYFFGLVETTTIYLNWLDVIYV